jgi:alpha-1,6-mannosyltransferase
VRKTLHLTNAYHASSGGIRTFYHALLHAADRRERAVRLVVPSDRSHVEDVNRWARIYHIRAPRAPFVDRRYRTILPHRYLFGRTGAIWRILHDERPDLIEICDKYSLVYLGGLIRRRWLAGRQRPALAALTCERMDDNLRTFLSRRPAADSFARWYIRYVYMPQFDGHVAVSSYTAGELAPDLRPVTVAPMGVDLATFANTPRTPEGRTAAFGALGGDPRTVILLYVGRLGEEKNLPLLLDGLEALPSSPDRSFHLMVAGEGRLRHWLESEGGRRTPGRLHLLGHFDDRDALARCYAHADLLVHPNTREPFGLVPLEAMASGLPVVLPRAGGVLEYADDINAWLYAPTVAGLCATVMRAMNDPAARAERAARAKATAAALDWRSITDHYFRIYDRIIATSQATRPVMPHGWRRKIVETLMTR